jgi:hypothetical protein
MFVPAAIDMPTPTPAVKRPSRPRRKQTIRDAGVLELEIDGIATRGWPRRRCQDGCRCYPCPEGDPVIGPTGAVKAMVATKPVNFRKGTDGLAALVREQIGARASRPKS